MKYTKEMFECVVPHCFSITQVMRKLGLKSISGSTHGHITKKVHEFGIDISHFKRYNKNKSFSNRKHWSLVLAKSNYKLDPKRLKDALLESGRQYICVKCGIIDVWQNEPI